MSFRTLHEFGADEIIINKSRFIGYAKPVESEEEAIEFIDHIKSEHRDATHNVYAYVVGPTDNIQRYSDDGEPSGTAGIPILDIIKKEELKNTVIVVTRYFGGIKLGAGGLIRAYIKGAKIGIDAAKIVEKKLYKKLKVTVDYTLHGKIENAIMGREEFILADTEFDSAVNYFVLCLKDDLDSFVTFIRDLSSDNFEYEELEEMYLSVKDGSVLL